MKISQWFPVMTAMTVFLSAGAPAATAAKLKIGDPAPALQVGKWVQGEPVAGFDKQHVYIVEFWATWCGPCKASIPHLNEKWKKFQDKHLVVIGVDCWEDDDSGVAPFVKKMGDRMTYRVALDDKRPVKKGAMAANWMDAAGQNGIPTAFVVNRQGQIAWIGHPMELEDTVIQQILDDQFDVAAFARQRQEEQAAQKAQETLERKLDKAIRKEKWAAAESLVADLEKSLPSDQKSQVGTLRLQILLGKKDQAGACQLAGSLSDAQPDDADLQNQMAGLLAAAKDMNLDGFALAEKIAGRANLAAKEKSPEILDTLARTQFLTGKTNAAVATEQKALALADEDDKDQYKESLKHYQAGKLPDADE